MGIGEVKVFEVTLSWASESESIIGLVLTGSVDSECPYVSLPGYPTVPVTKLKTGRVMFHVLNDRSDSVKFTNPSDSPSMLFKFSLGLSLYW